MRAFHSGWFGAVMGIAIVGVRAFMNPGNLAALQPLMRVIGVALFILLVVFWLVVTVRTLRGIRGGEV